RRRRVDPPEGAVRLLRLGAPGTAGQTRGRGARVGLGRGGNRGLALPERPQAPQTPPAPLAGVGTVASDDGNGQRPPGVDQLGRGAGRPPAYRARPGVRRRATPSTTAVPLRPASGGTGRGSNRPNPSEAATAHRARGLLR